MFAGRDVSRALSTMRTHDIKDCWDDLSDLPPIQQQSLDKWEAMFKGISKMYEDRQIYVQRVFHQHETEITLTARSFHFPVQTV